jgi:hypothetical protein
LGAGRRANRKEPEGKGKKEEEKEILEGHSDRNWREV